jgi:transcriptional regulator of nitric oxide reductase
MPIILLGLWALADSSRFPYAYEQYNQHQLSSSKPDQIDTVHTAQKITETTVLSACLLRRQSIYDITVTGKLVDRNTSSTNIACFANTTSEHSRIADISDADITHGRVEHTLSSSTPEAAEQRSARKRSDDDIEVSAIYQ